MAIFITLITLTHGALYFYDEYILHKKREFSKKEVYGGFVDGFIFLILVGLTLFTHFTENLKIVYIVMSFLSCLSILKNEYFYPKDLDWIERMVHAGLYILHPLILYAFYHSWKAHFFKTELLYWMLQLCYFILCFKAINYHLIYWNYIAEKKIKNGSDASI